MAHQGLVAVLGTRARNQDHGREGAALAGRVKGAGQLVATVRVGVADILRNVRIRLHRVLGASRAGLVALQTLKNQRQLGAHLAESPLDRLAVVGKGSLVGSADHRHGERQRSPRPRRTPPESRRCPDPQRTSWRPGRRPRRPDRSACATAPRGVHGSDPCALEVGWRRSCASSCALRKNIASATHGDGILVVHSLIVRLPRLAIGVLKALGALRAPPEKLHIERDPRSNGRSVDANDSRDDRVA